MELPEHKRTTIFGCKLLNCVRRDLAFSINGCDDCNELGKEVRCVDDCPRCAVDKVIAEIKQMRDKKQKIINGFVALIDDANYPDGSRYEDQKRLVVVQRAVLDELLTKLGVKE